MVEYLPADVTEPAELVAQIRNRRGGHLLNLDRILLKSPEFAKGWSAQFGVLRGDAISVDKKYRELAICAVAVLNEAEYEFYQHEPDWRAAGATDEQVLAIRQVNNVVTTAVTSDEAMHPDIERCFDTVEKQVIRLTIQMTKSIKTDPELMKSLKSNLFAVIQSRQGGAASSSSSSSRGTSYTAVVDPDAPLIELVGVIAGYNMVSRVLVALSITADGVA